MKKKQLSERDICTKFITPTLEKAGYADMLQVPFLFSSNGDAFLFHNKIAADLPGDGIVERELALHEFPTAETLWQWWARHRGLNDQQNALLTQDCFSDGIENNFPRKSDP